MTITYALQDDLDLRGERLLNAVGMAFLWEANPEIDYDPPTDPTDYLFVYTFNSNVYRLWVRNTQPFATGGASESPDTANSAYWTEIQVGGGQFFSVGATPPTMRDTGLPLEEGDIWLDQGNVRSYLWNINTSGTGMWVQYAGAGEFTSTTAPTQGITQAQGDARYLQQDDNLLDTNDPNAARNNIQANPRVELPGSTTTTPILLDELRFPDAETMQIVGSDGNVRDFTGGGGAETFLELTDTPTSYPSGSAGFNVQINTTENGIAFVRGQEPGREFNQNLAYEEGDIVTTIISGTPNTYRIWIATTDLPTIPQPAADQPGGANGSWLNFEDADELTPNELRTIRASTPPSDTTQNVIETTTYANGFALLTSSLATIQDTVVAAGGFLTYDPFASASAPAEGNGEWLVASGPDNDITYTLQADSDQDLNVIDDGQPFILTSRGVSIAGDGSAPIQTGFLPAGDYLCFRNSVPSNPTVITFSAGSLRRINADNTVQSRFEGDGILPTMSTFSLRFGDGNFSVSTVQFQSDFTISAADHNGRFSFDENGVHTNRPMNFNEYQLNTAHNAQPVGDPIDGMYQTQLGLQAGSFIVNATGADFTVVPTGAPVIINVTTSSSAGLLSVGRFISYRTDNSVTAPAGELRFDDNRLYALLSDGTIGPSHTLGYTVEFPAVNSYNIQRATVDDGFQIITPGAVGTYDFRDDGLYFNQRPVAHEDDAITEWVAPTTTTEFYTEGHVVYTYNDNVYNVWRKNATAFPDSAAATTPPYNDFMQTYWISVGDNAEYVVHTDLQTDISNLTDQTLVTYVVTKTTPGSGPDVAQDWFTINGETPDLSGSDAGNVIKVNGTSLTDRSLNEGPNIYQVTFGGNANTIAASGTPAGTVDSAEFILNGELDTANRRRIRASFGWTGSADVAALQRELNSEHTTNENQDATLAMQRSLISNNSHRIDALEQGGGGERYHTAQFRTATSAAGSGTELNTYRHRGSTRDFTWAQTFTLGSIPAPLAQTFTAESTALPPNIESDLNNYLHNTVYGHAAGQTSLDRYTLANDPSNQLTSGGRFVSPIALLTITPSDGSTAGTPFHIPLEVINNFRIGTVSHRMIYPFPVNTTINVTTHSVRYFIASTNFVYSPAVNNRLTVPVTPTIAADLRTRTNLVAHYTPAGTTDTVTHSVIGVSGDNASGVTTDYVNVDLALNGVSPGSPILTTIGSDITLATQAGIVDNVTDTSIMFTGGMDGTLRWNATTNLFEFVIGTAVVATLGVEGLRAADSINDPTL